MPSDESTRSSSSRGVEFRDDDLPIGSDKRDPRRRQAVTHSPSVAVVIPTYERREHLLRAVKSALDQTRPIDGLVIVDDASSFSVKTYLDGKIDDDRLSVVRFDRNRGAAAARNAGVKRTECQLVAFLDSDDYWHPQKLERQLTILEENPEAEVVYCDQYIVDARGGVRPSGKELPERDIWDHLVEGWTAPNTSTLVVNRGWFQFLGGFDPTLSSCQDHDLWMRIGRSGASVKVVEAPLTYFTRDADERISADHSPRIEGVEQFLEKWREAITESEGKSGYVQFERDYYAKTILPLAYLSLVERDFRTLFGLLSRYLLFNPAAYRRGIEMGTALLRRFRW